jgi:D-galactarolactone cycloisomerase
VEPDDEPRIAAIREAIGPDVKMMLDFGNPAYWDPHWNVAAAIRAARLLQDYDVYFWEEALQPHDVAGFRELSAAVDMNIATGESLTRIDEFERFIEARAVDVVQPDAVQIGITQLVHVARRSEEAGILCIPHSPWSAVAVAAHLNVLATVSNGALVEYPALASFEPGSTAGAATAFMNFELVDQPITLVDGLLQLPSSPGLGVGGFRPEAVARVAAGDPESRWQ